VRVAWWISGGIVVLALVGFALAVLKVLSSVRRLGIVAVSLERRLTDGARRLEPRVLALRATTEAMQPRLEAAQERALVIQARRGAADDN
jgi:hypothetical protein